MAGLQDVQNSLGFLALQAEAADEQRKQKEAFAREQAAAESSAQGFDRMTQMLSVLDARRQAKHDRDMEIAQLAGKAGVALSDEQGNEAKGRFAIGEALSAAEERKAREKEEARMSLEAFQQRGQDRRAEEARKAAMERTDKYINATNQRTELNIDARDRSKAADIASREKIAEMKKKPGKGGGKPKPGAEGGGMPEGAIPLEKAPKSKLQNLLYEVRASNRLLQDFSTRYTPADLEQLTNKAEQLKRKAESFGSTIPFTANYVSDEDRAEIEKYERLGNDLRRAISEATRRFGAALTGREKEIAESLTPNTADSVPVLIAKLEEAIQYGNESDEYLSKVLSQGYLDPYQETEVVPFSERQAGALGDPDEERAAQELAGGEDGPL